MRRLITLTLFLFVAVSAAPRSTQKIVGGTVTTIDQYPSIASLLYSSNLQTYTQNCGGTILTTSAILTAAHCPDGDAVYRWRVRAGSSYASSGGTVYTLASIIIHPSYNNKTQNNDIAIMRTATIILYSALVQSASIPSANYVLADNQIVWAAGWGATSYEGLPSEQLRHVQIWTINQVTCNLRYGGAITDNMLCSGWLDVGGRDQCQGDSGGPLYHNGIVVGISSWGTDCASSYHPGVNTRVSRTQLGLPHTHRIELINSHRPRPMSGLASIRLYNTNS